MTPAEYVPHCLRRMSAIDEFLRLVELFRQARGISEARASTIILNGGGRIASIRRGESDIGSRRLAEAVRYLSDHWPDDVQWPADLPRPEPTRVPAPAEGAA